MILLLILLLTAALTVPAFAITESEVEAQVSSAGKETVCGNVLIWFLCAVAFLKVSQKIDSFMASLGVNVGHTGGSMLAEAMIAARGISTVVGMTGRTAGSLGRRAVGGSTASGASPSGLTGVFQGGLAGIVSRKVTSDAVKTATTQTSAVHTAQAASTVHTAHTASEQQSVTVGHTERTAQASSQVTQSTHTVSAGQQTHTAQHTRQTTAAQGAASKGAVSQAVSSSATSHHTSLGGAIYKNSLQTGGHFANDVIGMVARGDVRSTGTITGDMASQAMMSYMGITALGETAVEKISYSDVEIGGGKILGTEITAEHPQGIAFGMYHVDQYAAPEGEYSKVFSADGSQWYKQYAVDTVAKTPFKAPDGEIDYNKEIVQRLPQPPKRKDRT
jgi:hypothetical protein